MINQSSNQTSGTRPKVLAVSKTFIPYDYDKSTEGYNAWTRHIRSEVHGISQHSRDSSIYHNLFKNVIKKGK